MRKKNIHFCSGDFAASPVGMKGLQLPGFDTFMDPARVENKFALFPGVLPP